ncbi:MAG TPA: UPF0179 family protein [Candidatus Deferrimicrobium sp.]|nr:UPF0179 family protein [Candidatus Deferrimicrobium sp.]
MSKILTLIGVKLAEKNKKFLFTGAAKECDDCPPSLKSVCIGNLEKGYIYEIIEIRKVIHPCIIHEGGVAVVEVQKATIQAAIASKLAFEGATISFPPPDCSEVSCKNFQYCKPIGINQENKYKIIKIFGNVPNNCRKEKRLKLVELKP